MSDLLKHGKNDLAKRQNDFGVLYFVDENPQFRKMLQMSIQSLKRFHPHWPIEVVEVPSFHVPMWKKLYRTVSFWKWDKRRDRAGQDIRVIAAKADVMLKTPFRRTLYLDVDTIVMKPLNAFHERALESDVVITPLPWKTYYGVEPWQPETWPYVMAGILFYSDHFSKVYRTYIEKFDSNIVKLLSQEQFVLSLTCHMEAERLNIVYDTYLQIDALNLAQHLGTENYPRSGDCIDLSWEGLSKFHIFHYNEYKPQYMKHIKEVWGYPLDER